MKHLCKQSGGVCLQKTGSPLFFAISLALFCPDTSATTRSTVPDAGTFGNQLRQESARTPISPVGVPLVVPSGKEVQSRLTTDNHTTVVVRKVFFTGMPVGQGPSEHQLQQLLTGMLNRPLTFHELMTMTREITNRYRSEGFLVARAILPPQTIKDGELTINIIPGRYDRVQLNNSSPLRDGLALQLIRTTTPEGGVLTRAQVEREAILLGDIPGVNTRVVMKSGSKPGTTTPDITLTSGKRFGGYVGMDNQGDRTTGRSRGMAGFYVNGLLGTGDLLQVNLLDAYENSGLINGSLDYSTLASGYGTRVGLSYSHLNYHYSLSGFAFDGYSDNWGMYVSQPWIRTSRSRVDIRLDAGQQYLTDKYPQILVQPSGRKGRKQVNAGTLSLTGSVADLTGGVSGFVVSGTVGNVDLRSELSRDWAAAAGNDGQFVRFNYRLNHDQRVWGPLSLFVNLNGQMSDHNLDTSQKFLMGGPTAVRAYDIGDGAVDEGVVGTVEIRSRWDISALGWMGAVPQLTVAAFYDQGYGQQYRHNASSVMAGDRLANDNNLNLAGAGLYTTVADAGDYALTLTWARRTGNADPNAVHDDRNRFWVSAVKTF
ncbi:ShlB/FhaC/HecB family hemolysin secretion/activation protein [Salmonella enterica]|nr:ShlB/FhaC/HecB family hemolysin secretion/activation protein [Salmonella enterica]EHQ9355027.1 ShlB/FhaC/HecB family hemolysin secretion/activation protein [Salmonella enterica]EHR1671020.1 ShlB/FhaC/HecB family hemolysin secretion/activation protein [Salmonella enterica]EHR8097484.1 ShlB/FhaC/HecB family hemolysin secretion/activation protein [Salmonella enterica]EIE9498692.1 ShlB/FhaC/HecB family hemolysin secretion/activation protein [Salmonella enterica]